MKKRIIIMGGGFAGLRTFYNLTKEDHNLEITVIDKRKKVIEKPSLPEVAFDKKPVSEVLIEISKPIKDRGGKYINDEVINIFPESNALELKSGQKFSYDYLIIAAGAIKDYLSIKGFDQYGYSVCDDIHSEKLRKKLEKFEGGNIVIGTAKSEFGNRVKAPKLKAPCEGPVGEAMFMIDYDLRKRKLREKTIINVFSPGEVFFEDVGDHVREEIGQIMKRKEINLAVNKVIKEITEDEIYFEDGTKMPCDLAIIIPPYKAFPLFVDSGLGDDKGYIPTDKTMKHLDYDNIYAVGDINALSQPKLGHIAVHQADIAVSSIMKDLTGKGEIIPYRPSVFCIMNMGGAEAALIYSDKLYHGENDLVFYSPIAKMMKWSFDTYYFFTHGHMFPNFAVKGMEKFLDLFKEDPNKYLPFE